MVRPEGSNLFFLLRAITNCKIGASQSLKPPTEVGVTDRPTHSNLGVANPDASQHTHSQTKSHCCLPQKKLGCRFPRFRMMPGVLEMFPAIRCTMAGRPYPICPSFLYVVFLLLLGLLGCGQLIDCGCCFSDCHTSNTDD